MDVIGLGLPRTGTLSLKLALEQIGFGPCYHMTEFAQRPDDWSSWLSVHNGEVECWGRIFDSYRSAVDAPTCWFAESLIAAFPQSRFILTERDESAWIKSAMQTVFRQDFLPRETPQEFRETLSKLGSRFLQTPGLKRGESPFGHRLTPSSAFQAHNTYIRQVVPSDRLLIFEV